MNVKSRISALRVLMRKHRIQGYVVPSSDEHQDEYVPSFWQRRAWISGFTGSVGDFALSLNSAGIWIDGRYVLQATRETSGSGVKVMRNWLTEVPSIAGWFGSQLRKGAIVGIDPQVVSIRQYEKIERELAEHGISLKPVAENLVDALWKDKPAEQTNPVFVHPLKYAGESHIQKIARLRKAMAEAGATSHVISALDSVAWLLNLRGSDVQCNPVFIAHVIVTAKSVVLYTDLRKVTREVRSAVSKQVSIRHYKYFPAALKALATKQSRVWLDPTTTSRWVSTQLSRAGKVIVRESPIVLMRAMKNQTEIRGAITAHVRDGVAMTRFLCWFDAHAGKTRLTEMDLAEKCETFRRKSKLYIGPSFDTIAGAGPNGAIVHYRATRETNSVIRNNTLVVFDSGAQYPEGTTDITRTLLVGNATREMRRRFTLMLKGHLALHLTSFPAGTLDMHLDSLARQYLWRDGLDYLHGTGHGIGSFLCVHEKPQIIGQRKDAGVPLALGMITSNEPGYYKSGEYGMRQENLVYTVVDTIRSSADKQFFRLENLTLCPIDTRLIDKNLLTRGEVNWLNTYHADVQTRLARYLNSEERKWLARVTRPI